VLAVAIALCLGGCGSKKSDPETPPPDPEASAEALKRNCADPHWKDENLGLWYSVCRQPLRW
jgi:hypothetical protein